jgi:RHS repeat-associated protein
VVGTVVTTPPQYQSVTSGPSVNGLITAGNYQCRLLRAGDPVAVLAGVNAAGFCGSKFVFDGTNPYGNCACPSGSTLINGACHSPNLGSSARAPAPVLSSTPPRPQACQNQGPTQFGNPLHGATGNKYQSESDYASTEGALRFERHYNSQGPEYGRRPMGALWRHSFDARLERITDTLTKAYRANGQVVVFAKTGTDWIATAEVTDRLAETVTGFTLINGNEDSEDYNAGGQLTRIQSPSGQQLNLTYSDANTPSTTAPLPGLLVRVEDSFGHMLALTYDENLRIVTLSDPAGGQYGYTYDSRENLVSVSYPDATPQDPNDNPKRLYHYEDSRFPNALTGITDENGARFATYTYDALGRAVSSEHAGGVLRYLLAFNADGSSSVTDPLNTTRNHSFQSILGAIRNANESQPCPSCGGSNVAARSFDANGNVIAATDFNGNQTTYAYDLARNLEISRTEAVGTPQQRTIATEWHPTFRLPIRLTEPNRITEWSHDAQGNVLTHRVTDSATGLTRMSSYSYNAIGQVLTVDGPRTDVMDVTTYTYYPNDPGQGSKRGMLAFVTSALGHTVQITGYDAHGRALSMTDPNGLVSSMSYDARGRLLSRTVGSETTAFEYDGVGQLKKVILPDASFVSYTYDAAHRLNQIQDHLGNRIVYTLDSIGNRTREEVYFPNGTLAQTHSRSFDALNRLAQDISALNQTTTYSYDSQGNLKTVTDPLGRVTTRGYDVLNRMNKVTDALNGIALYDFDANDRIRQVTDPRGLATVYRYNGLDDLTQQVSPDTGTTINTFDAAGNLKTMKDANNITATYTYDALNRLTQKAVSTTVINYSYDSVVSGNFGKGRLTGMTDATGSTAYTYDVFGRVIKKTHTPATNFGTGALSVQYAYDSFGRMASITYPSGRVVNYAYTNGRVSAITVGATQTVINNIAYFGFATPASWTQGSGKAYSRSFDANGRIASYTNNTSQIVVGFDLADNITQLTDPGASTNTKSFAYDKLNRLTGYGTNAGASSQGFAYDAVGNRQSTLVNGASTSYTTATTSNRLTSLGANAYGYSAAGNQTSAPSRTYSYDVFNRMTTATVSGVVTQYRYNGIGQRLRKSGANLARFVYDEQGQLIGEYSNTGVMTREIVWLNDIPLAIMMPSGTATNLFYIDSDHLNTPRTITNQAKQKRWEWNSDPFGTILANENPAALGVFTFNLRFAGQYFDKETGLHYNYFRDYNPSIGRYIQSDPIGLIGGLNTYAYVEGNPATASDPLGLFDGSTFFTAARTTATAIGTGFINTIGVVAAGMFPTAAGEGSDVVPTASSGSNCPPDDPCDKVLDRAQLKTAGIRGREHEVKSDALGTNKGLSRFDLCGCNDGRVVVKAHGCKGPIVETTPYRWK